jgi:hypothetical protein
MSTLPSVKWTVMMTLHHLPENTQYLFSVLLSKVIFNFVTA